MTYALVEAASNTKSAVGLERARSELVQAFYLDRAGPPVVVHAV